MCGFVVGSGFGGGGGGGSGEFFLGGGLWFWNFQLGL